jgi:BMFP domain-containing protein YqiC
MQSENRLFDDFVKVMNGAAGTLAGMGREAEGAFRDRMREWMGGIDMVSREEFDAVKAIAVAAREENQALKARLDALDAAAAAKRAKKSTASAGPDA